MPILHRVAGPLLLLGAGSLLLAIPFGVATGMQGTAELPWLVLGLTFLAAAAQVRRRLPDHAIASWFAVVAGGLVLIQALDGVLVVLVADADTGAVVAWASLGYHLGAVALVIAIAHVLGLFPDGRAEPTERRVLRTLWALFVVPPLALLVSPTVVLPAHLEAPPVPNPYHLTVAAGLEIVALIGIGILPAGFLVGGSLLVRRYLRGSRDRRRRIRWLLLPALLAGFATVLETLALATGPQVVPGLAVNTVWLASLLTLPVAVAIALLRPDLLDVDRVLRKSLVYGSLWTLIAVVYAAAAAGLGMAAGRRLDVGVAILLTVGATLVFQPARRRLERLADRWVFGARVDPAHLVSRLGAALAETFDLDTLLPHIAETLQQGLGVRWVRVRLESDGGSAPTGLAGEVPPAGRDPHEDGAHAALTVPIVLGTETLGEVQCGPRANGTPLTDADIDLVATLSRQAALAVRNVKLSAELGDRLEQVRDQAAELERSRARLVRAQDDERRRIERNIHDGAQQDLVALLGHAGRLRRQLDHDPAAAAELVDQHQVGLRRVIAELRELAHGIHPTLLADRGLLEAVEALAARSTVPVSVRADPSLRSVRFPAEIEGAGYFTVAEALTNVVKHADADRAEVTLQRTNGSLSIEIRDDGTGFEGAGAAGHGLVNLTERLTALGGRLDVASDGTGTVVRALLVTGEPEATGG